MPFKDLLVDIDSSKACAARLDAAIRLAQSYKAHLAGLYAKADLSIPGFAESQIPAEVLAAGRQRIKDYAAAAETMFRQATEKAGVSAEWRCVSGDRVGVLALHGRYADLTIVGQTDKDDPFSASMDLAGKLIFEVGGPVLSFRILALPTGLVNASWWRGTLAVRQCVRFMTRCLCLNVRRPSTFCLSTRPAELPEMVKSRARTSACILQGMALAPRLTTSRRTTSKWAICCCRAPLIKAWI